MSESDRRGDKIAFQASEKRGGGIGVEENYLNGLGFRSFEGLR